MAGEPSVGGARLGARLTDRQSVPEPVPQMPASAPLDRSPRRRAHRDTRSALLAAAAAVFSTKGVSAASVDDIVREAGVAKGTFYLYFATKDDAVTAVAEAMVEEVADRIAAITGDETVSPVERLLGFGAAVSQVGGQPHERDLIEVFHRPENRALHDRVGERALVRLAPSIAAVIEAGIERGDFRPQDPGHAATWVMACFGSLHELVTDPDEVAAVFEELNTFVLGGLGYAPGGAR
jgi:AcrR family transcriptional regulator